MIFYFCRKRRNVHFHEFIELWFYGRHQLIHISCLMHNTHTHKKFNLPNGFNYDHYRVYICNTFVIILLLFVVVVVVVFPLVLYSNRLNLLLRQIILNFKSSNLSWFVCGDVSMKMMMVMIIMRSHHHLLVVRFGCSLLLPLLFFNLHFCWFNCIW